MKKTSNTLIFFGNERLSTGLVPEGAPTLQALIDDGYDVKAVVSHYTRATSRKARTLEVQEVAEKNNIPVLLPEKLRDIKDQLIEYEAEAGVLVAYGKLVPQDIIEIFPKGIINIHPSLLPKYRGSTPIETALLEGATKTGVSLMQLVREMDAGPTWAQNTLMLNGNEAKQDLTKILLNTGKDMLIEHLPSILDGTLKPQPQNNIDATYTKLLGKEDGILDPKNKSASQLEREIRAFATWPKSRLTLGALTVIALKAKPVTTRSSNTLTIACAKDTLLEIEELLAPNGKKMSGEALLRGYDVMPESE